MKDKIKKAVCLGLVFITSFMLTVTAFSADDDNPTFVIQNKNYFGTYDSNESAYGFVKVNSEKFSVFAYYDNETGYISGSSQDGALTSDYYGFTFPTVLKCNSDGDYSGNKLNNVTITGKTKVALGGFMGLSIKSIKLTPSGQTKRYYTYVK